MTLFKCALSWGFFNCSVVLPEIWSGEEGEKIGISMQESGADTYFDGCTNIKAVFDALLSQVIFSLK